MERLKSELERSGKISFKLKVRPGAGKTSWREPLQDGTLRADIAAAPEKGRANAELVDFLAEEFGVSRNSVSVAAGAGGRVKIIKIINERKPQS